MDFKILTIVLGTLLLISIVLNITIPLYIGNNDDYPTKSSLLESAESANYIIPGLSEDQNNIINAYLNKENGVYDPSLSLTEVLEDYYNMTKDQIDTAIDEIVNTIGLLYVRYATDAGLSQTVATNIWNYLYTLNSATERGVA